MYVTVILLTEFIVTLSEIDPRLESMSLTRVSRGGHTSVMSLNDRRIDGGDETVWQLIWVLLSVYANPSMETLEYYSEFNEILDVK